MENAAEPRDPRAASPEPGDAGVLVIAHGAPAYIELARNLARSLDLRDPDVPRALVTDADDPELLAFYPRIVPIDPSKPGGLLHKLGMYEYSPFERTLFIDADCLAVRSIRPLLDRFRGHEVAVLGRQETSGNHFFDLERARSRFGVTEYPVFNGGVYYFEKSPKAQAVFEAARDFVDDYDALSMPRFTGKMGDEPLVSLAMAIHGCRAVPDPEGLGMKTPVGIRGCFRISVLRGDCRFDKAGQNVRPAIVHFGGACLGQYHYAREARKLRWRTGRLAWDGVLDRVVDLVSAPPYAAEVAAFRLLKRVRDRRPWKLFPLLPVHRHE